MTTHPNHRHHHHPMRGRSSPCSSLVLLIGLGLIAVVVTQFLVLPYLWSEGENGGGMFLSAASSPALSDATFVGLPLRLVSTKSLKDSQVHCVGQAPHASTAWMSRSCHYQTLCLDTNTSTFVLVAPSKPMPPFRHSSTWPLNQSVALGGLNPRWKGRKFNQGMEKVKWAPRLVLDKADLPTHFYQLPDNVVWTPFHSMAGHNVGHLLWDDFLPLFTLWTMFDLLSFDFQLLRWTPPSNQFLYGTCEMRRNKKQQCAANFERFLPLLGISPSTFTVLDQATIRTTGSSSTVATSLVCAKQGVAGIGLLTDHGHQDHGWNMDPALASSVSVHNVGRGALLAAFREFLVSNMLGEDYAAARPKDDTYRIVFSIHSSSEEQRDLDFARQRQQLLSLEENQVQVDSVQFSKMPLGDQVRLADRTNLLVTAAGGGAVTATFLPPGASLIVYYASKGGYDFFADMNLTGNPAVLDWDLLNNLSYLRVHWLPIEEMNTEQGLQALQALIQYEVAIKLSPA